MVFIQFYLGLYSIYLDISFNDKTNIWGYGVGFSTGTHNWEFKKLILSFEKPIYKISFTLMFKKHSGTVYFDDIKLLEIL
jgi:hypothetical protein